MTRHIASACLLFGVALSSLGCSRSFWRRDADTDAYSLAAQKLTDLRWDVPRLDLQPDCYSRFYDPYDPDHGALPPDDPAAHVFMHHPGGMEGSDSWHKVGDAISIENPQWLEPFGLTIQEYRPGDGAEPRKIPAIENLSLTEALELSYIHNRDYQTQIEDLYLTSLALSFERFQFNVRWLGIGGREPSAGLAGQTQPDGSDTVNGGARMGVSQLLPGGAQWVVEIANNTLWLFSGSNQANSASVLSYSLTQPLLMAAGRKFVLENLTQAERDVLYSARSLARFRRVFFENTVAGSGGTGFLSVLAQFQSVQNQTSNVARIESQLEYAKTLAARRPDRMHQALEQLPANLVFPESISDQIRYVAESKQLQWIGELSPQQEEILLGLSDDPDFRLAAMELVRTLRTEVRTETVLQLESQLVSSQLSLVRSERTSQDVLDRFKLQLGLPPDLELTVDDSLLAPFQLIDPQLSQAEQLAKDYVEDWGKLTEGVPTIEQMRTVTAGLQKIAAGIRTNGLDIVQSDFDRLTKQLANGSGYDSDPVALARVKEDLARDRRSHADSGAEIERKDKRLVEILKTLEADAIAPEVVAALISELATIREELLKVSQNLQVVQIGTRVDLIELNPFNMSLEEAIQTALSNRLDLMNARARVMDARRLIEIRANELEGVLDVVVDGDIRANTSDGPISNPTHSFRAGIAFTAPLDQINERNAYRQSQIAYQRARRDYIALEDLIKQQVRDSWRQLTVIRDNFDRTNRRSVRLAAQQYDIAVENASAPGQSNQNAFSLLRALADVLQAQNSLIGDWTNFEQTRIRFHRDLGTMEIDERGLWQDEFYNSLRDQDDEQLAPSEPLLESSTSRTPIDVDVVSGDTGDEHNFVPPAPAALPAGTGEGAAVGINRQAEPGNAKQPIARLAGRQVGQARRAAPVAAVQKGPEHPAGEPGRDRGWTRSTRVAGRPSETAVR